MRTQILSARTLSYPFHAILLILGILVAGYGDDGFSADKIQPKTIITMLHPEKPNIT